MFLQICVQQSFFPSKATAVLGGMKLQKEPSVKASFITYLQVCCWEPSPTLAQYLYPATQTTVDPKMTEEDAASMSVDLQSNTKPEEAGVCTCAVSRSTEGK